MSHYSQFLKGEISVYKFLDGVSDELRSKDNKQLFENNVLQFGQQILESLFSEDPFRDEIIKNSKAYITTICIICSEACCQLSITQLCFLEQRIPIYIMENTDQSQQKTLVSIFESYCRNVVKVPNYLFINPPIELLLKTFQNRFLLNQDNPDVIQLLQLLSLYLIFDQNKIIFVTFQGFDILAPFLATAEDQQLISALLSLFHSCVFNLNDDSNDKKQSIYDIVSGSFAAIDPPELLKSVIEKLVLLKQEDQKRNPETCFSVLMFIHDALLPSTKGVASFESFNFCIDNLDVLQNDVEIQICLENLIKIFGLNQQISKFGRAVVEKFEVLFKLLNMTENVQIALLLCNILQLGVINSGHSLLGGDQNYEDVKLPDMRPILRWIFNFSKMLKEQQSIYNSVESLETACAVAVFLQEAFGAQYKDLAIHPEAGFLLQFAVILFSVEGLLETIPAFLAFLASLCDAGLVQNYLIIMQQAQNPDCHSDLVNFLVGICNVLYEQKNADIVIKQYANTLQKNRDILKGFQDEKILVKYIKNLKEMHLDDVARETFVDIKYIAVAQALE